MRSINNKKQELELYIHIPFCKKKCAYCDFLSFACEPDAQYVTINATQEEHIEQSQYRMSAIQSQETVIQPQEMAIQSQETNIQAYMKALQQEILVRAGAYQEYEICSVFIGGGTPSILEADQITELMQSLHTHFQIAADAEITMECNPGTVNYEKLEAMARAGIHRISFGAQSANDVELKQLGRIHSWEEVLESVALARQVGFTNYNIDVMMALPGQTVESYCHTLEAVCALEPTHISAYSLIIEPGTRFYQRYEQAALLREEGKPQQELPSEEAEREMYVQTKQILQAHGYQQYEISNFARSGYVCRHNIGYWKRTDYLGLGLGSSSCVNEHRFVNESNLSTYIEEKNIFVEEVDTDRTCRKEEEVLSIEAQMEETMFLGLRLLQGVEKAVFAQKFGKTVYEVYGAVIDKLKAEELLEENESHLYLTSRGLDVANYCMAEFLLS